MKIALVCSGLGIFWRGYERVTRELFDLLKQDMNITLFKGHGQRRCNEVVVPFLKRNWIMPFLKHDVNKAKYLEQMSYAIPFSLYALLKGYDIVHYINPQFGNFLSHIRDWLGLKFQLIYTHTLGMEPKNYPHADYFHQVSPTHFQKALDFGLAESNMLMIPHGIHTKQFLISEDKMKLRKLYNIPPDKHVILSVAAINRDHKRVHYLVNEVSKLGKDFFLLVAGNLEDPSIKTLAEKLLGDNFMFTYVPFARITELYRVSDVFTVCSLVEGFCLAVVEAMCAKVPVITHRNEHFQWLLGDKRCLVDMRKECNLAQRIKRMIDKQDETQEIVENNYKDATRRFDWANLKDDYIRMYREVSKRS